jgi:pimeloyl-ACP methyl ester carboxylesterase
LNRMKIQRMQTLAGSLSQTAATWSHNLTAAQLHKIGETIPKILVLTGDVDHLIKPVNSEYIHQHMPQAEYQVWEGVGHGLVGQLPKKFNETLERIITEGRERGTQAPWV